MGSGLFFPDWMFLGRNGWYASRPSAGSVTQWRTSGQGGRKENPWRPPGPSKECFSCFCLRWFFIFGLTKKPFREYFLFFWGFLSKSKFLEAFRYLPTKRHGTFWRYWHMFASFFLLPKGILGYLFLTHNRVHSPNEEHFWESFRKWDPTCPKNARETLFRYSITEKSPEKSPETLGVHRKSPESQSHFALTTQRAWLPRGLREDGWFLFDSLLLALMISETWAGYLSLHFEASSTRLGCLLCLLVVFEY